jgi:isopenicillin-N epimerase
VWSLSPEIHHLNHGSWGAVPTEIQEKQAGWRHRWEARTFAFILEELPPALEAARTALAGFLSCSADGLAFMRNATTAIASVVRSVEPWLMPGDQVVTTSHDYNAVRQTLDFTAARREAEVVVAPVPFPIPDPTAVTESVAGAVTDRTRLVVIDHITSPTGVVYPLADIVATLEPEIPVLVDGAHAPGQVGLELDALGASWYAGNLHKWVCAPKGSGFLYTRADRLGHTYPVVISHGWGSPDTDPSRRYQALFGWTGTDDVTAWLVVPDVIELMANLEPGGWPALMEKNHLMALAAREILVEALGAEPPTPDAMVGSMAALRLPDAAGENPGGIDAPLTRDLLAAGFEAPVMIWPRWPGQVLRVSAQHYNTLDEYEALAEVLRGLLV